MRLLMTTDTVGGVWTFTSELTQELLERDHAVELVSFGRLPSDEQNKWALAKEKLHPGRFRFTASPAPLEWSQDNDHSLTEGLPILTRLAERCAPDALLTNQYCFGDLPSELPRVIVAHSDVLSWARACRVAALTPSPWLAQYRAMVRDGLDRADAVVAPTHAVLEDLALNFRLPPRAEVIANGREIPPPYSTPVRKLQAITAGRLWDEAKGLDLLETCPLPLPVLIAGETEFEGEQARSLPGNVRRLGSLPALELQQRFRESAIYLCTSLYEPFGLAPLEAALCGCAILARDLPSLREVWGDDALYFRDAQGLATQVRRLTENELALATLAERGQRRAASFTTERMTEGYLQLLGELSASRPGKWSDEQGRAGVH